MPGLIAIALALAVLSGTGPGPAVAHSLGSEGPAPGPAGLSPFETMCAPACAMSLIIWVVTSVQ